MDAAGVVEAVGPDVSRLRVGDEVMAAIMPRRPEGGAQARHVIAPAASVVAVPEGAALTEASTLPMNGLTALRALELAALPPGRTLAVSGGAGLLAHYAIAAAKRQGLIVVADARREEVEVVRGYGADVVVARGPDFAGAVREAVPGGVDALLDTALLGEPAFGAIRDGGVYLPVRGWSASPGQRDIEIRPVFVVRCSSAPIGSRRYATRSGRERSACASPASSRPSTPQRLSVCWRPAASGDDLSSSSPKLVNGLAPRRRSVNMGGARLTIVDP